MSVVLSGGSQTLTLSSDWHLANSASETTSRKTTSPLRQSFTDTIHIFPCANRNPTSCDTPLSKIRQRIGYYANQSELEKKANVKLSVLGSSKHQSKGNHVKKQFEIYAKKLSRKITVDCVGIDN